ncbi:hypothetical protein CLIB1444_01S19922 [[Candida] jaroonii]|uniref:Uncharacterized protein n=1 Tax=[Candida] jaroonii TaxID=467808 RepID=A0ACA9Y274_9ASCO|nr:hypothetical protein CLIB1444_01S19922 [[Candida] jaroonii]
MSIVDVSQSVGELAAAVNEKIKELESLKSQYNYKLDIINQYISLLPTENNDYIDDDELIQIIKDTDGDFIKLPKKLIRVPEDIKKNTEDSGPQIRHLSLDSTNSNKVKETKYLNKSKKTCSYCNKTGHNRAKCFKRLNGEKPEPSNN